MAKKNGKKNGDETAPEGAAMEVAEVPNPQAATSLEEHAESMTGTNEAAWPEHIREHKAREKADRDAAVEKPLTGQARSQAMFDKARAAGTANAK